MNNNNFAEAEKLRKEIAEKEARLKELEKASFNPYGKWEVTTEGDEEGRSAKRLGTHEGNIFDIAKHLSSQVFYALNFKRIGYMDIEEINRPTKLKTVQVRIYEDSTAISDIVKIIQSAPEDVSVSDGNYYDAVKFTYK